MRTIPFVLLLLISAATPGFALPMFRITNLGTLPEDSFSWGTDVNDFGHVVGNSGGPSGFSGFLWNGGPIHKLAGLQDGVVLGRINNRGQVSGGDGNYSSAFLWQDALQRALSSSLTMIPGDLNDHGDVVGTILGKGGFIWGDNDLIEFSGPGPFTFAFGINNERFVTGMSGNRAFIWDGVAMTFLDVLGSAGYTINSRNQVAGQISIYDPATGDRSSSAFIWDGATVLNLGAMPGHTETIVTEINDAGFAVGRSGSLTETRAFLWYGDGMKDLNDLLVNGEGWTLSGASAISNTGYITGTGLYNGARRAYLLTPVSPAPLPEPGTWALAATSLAAFALYRRRQ